MADSGKTLNLAVAGNPNSGKTCLFNQLTGSSQRVGNYPGVTVDFVEGNRRTDGFNLNIIDLPGTYSLTAYSREETVARDFILNQKPDAIINVVDACNLERNLYLTAQLMELDIPIVIALNMMDVAERSGVEIDTGRLAAILGIPVIPTVASRGKGIDELTAAAVEVAESRRRPHPLSYQHELQAPLDLLTDTIEKHDAGKSHPPRWVALKLLEDDRDTIKRFGGDAGIAEAVEKAKKQIERHSKEHSSTTVAEARHAIATGAAAATVKRNDDNAFTPTQRIDSLVCHRFFGPLILLAVVYALFQFVFTLAQDWQWLPRPGGDWLSPTEAFEDFFAAMSNLAGAGISDPMLLSLVQDAIIGGVGGVMSFVPLIFFMFVFISILEDTGYVARVAFILDRVLRSFGLQGKSILAMIVSGGLGGGGCAVPGVMATRALREEKDRLVTILVAPMMNCGAKLPVYAVLIAAFFPGFRGAVMFSLWLLSWIFALISAWILRKLVVKGEQTPFVMELPTYHLPTIRGVLTDTWQRTWMYIKKAGTIILAINIILWVLMYFPSPDRRPFERERQRALTTMMAKIKNSPTTHAGIKRLNPEDIAGFAARFELSAGLSAEARGEASLELRHENPDLFKVLSNPETIENASVADAISGYRQKTSAIDAKLKAARLRGSFAGRIGEALTPVSSLAGFSWRENIALFGGFAAKEVVIGTLGTAYSMDSANPGEPLSQRLSAEPDWNTTRAAALMLFVMLYAPCLATIAAIKKETSWKWAAFAAVYSTALGFAAALAVNQGGRLLGF